MNYLAHIYLSGSNEEILIGNFIGDFVKGSDFNNYPSSIRQGILVHRHIDSFTDSHPTVRQSMSYFANRYHKYAGIITDILYDHYLTRHWDTYSSVPLDIFKSKLFDTLRKFTPIVPERVQRFIPSFITYDWIKNYMEIDGIIKVYDGMSKRTSLPNESVFALEVIEKNYELLETEFLTFFPELIDYISSKFSIEILPKSAL